MLQKQTVYQIKCDLCRQLFYSENRKSTSFTSPEEAIDNARREEWKVGSDRHICPDCQNDMKKQHPAYGLPADAAPLTPR